MELKKEEKVLSVGLSGKYGSGKGQVSTFLVELSPKTKVLPFAKLLKDYVSLLGGIDPLLLYSDEGKQKPNMIQEKRSFDELKPKIVELFGGYEFKKNQLEELSKECIDFMDGNSSWGKTLQFVGTEVFRNKVDSDFWIKVWKLNYEKYKETGVIVDDVRFKNEVKLLKELGFQIWRINSPIEERMKRIKTVRDPNHISETELDDFKEFDKIIYNDSSLEELKKSVTWLYYC